MHFEYVNRCFSNFNQTYQTVIAKIYMKFYQQATHSSVFQPTMIHLMLSHKSNDCIGRMSKTVHGWNAGRNIQVCHYFKGWPALNMSLMHENKHTSHVCSYV